MKINQKFILNNFFSQTLYLVEIQKECGEKISIISTKNEILQILNFYDKQINNIKISPYTGQCFIYERKWN